MMPLTNLDHYELILASKSPRRKQLLADLGLTFRVEVLDVDESFPLEMPAGEVAAYLADKKAQAFLPVLQPNQLVITADTVVVCDEQILNKPNDVAHAQTMLRQLSGKKHQVITGVCLLSEQKTVLFSVCTDVWFKELSEEEINFYIENYRPFDKAGAYGIQEWIGFIGIYRIDGSYFNVMGLPVQKLYEQLSVF